MKSREVMAGLVISTVLIGSTVSYSAAVFSGPLAPYLQVGIGYGLIGAFASALLFAACSRIPFSIAGPDSKPTAILAVLAAGAAAQRASGNPADRAATAILALIVGTALTGIVMYLFGAFRMGRFVRYVPYPVIGGFIGASGWLLILGAVRLLTGVELSWGTLRQFAEPHPLDGLGHSGGVDEGKRFFQEHQRDCGAVASTGAMAVNSQCRFQGIPRRQNAWNYCANGPSDRLTAVFSTSILRF